MKRALTLISILGIGCGITLLIVFSHGRGSDAPNTYKGAVSQTRHVVDNTETRQSTPLKQDTSKNSDDKVSNDPDDFYRVIIENNIFRPLNWKPTHQEPAWTLLGTTTTPDGSIATAYITERKTNQFYAVKIGEKIGDATVTEILPKQVTLDKGGETLNLYMASSTFLSRTSSSRSSSDRPPVPQSQVTAQRRNSQARSAKDKERQAWRDAQKEQITELKKMAEKLRAVSAEERRKMREYLEQRAIGNSR